MDQVVKLYTLNKGNEFLPAVGIWGKIFPSQIYQEPIKPIKGSTFNSMETDLGIFYKKEFLTGDIRIVALWNDEEGYDHNTSPYIVPLRYHDVQTDVQMGSEFRRNQPEVLFRKFYK
jgi:hypothetical protein